VVAVTMMTVAMTIVMTVTGDFLAAISDHDL
jgi:hypothetical protein